MRLSKNISLKLELIKSFDLGREDQAPKRFNTLISIALWAVFFSIQAPILFLINISGRESDFLSLVLFLVQDFSLLLLFYFIYLFLERRAPDHLDMFPVIVSFFKKASPVFVLEDNLEEVSYIMQNEMSFYLFNNEKKVLFILSKICDNNKLLKEQREDDQKVITP